MASDHHIHRIATVWRSRVARWHTNPALLWTRDDTQAHSGRLAQLAIMLWPKDVTRDMLMACALHDVPEILTADIAGPIKRTMPKALRHAWTDFEIDCEGYLGLPDVFLLPQDEERLKFVDRLDSLLWASAHMSDLPLDWWNERRLLSDMADALGLPSDLPGLLSDFVMEQGRRTVRLTMLGRACAAFAPRLLDVFPLALTVRS